MSLMKRSEILKAEINRYGLTDSRVNGSVRFFFFSICGNIFVQG